MRLRLLLSILLWAPVVSQFACTICKNGGSMSTPNGMVTTLEGQTATCATLVRHIGQLHQESCQAFQSIAGTPCGCPGFDVTTDFQKQYGGVGTPANTFQSGLFSCSICDGREMRNPNGYTLSMRGLPISCQELHDTRGDIPESACERVQSFASIPCGCDGGDTSPASTVAATSIASLLDGGSETYDCSVCGSGFIGKPDGVVVNDRGLSKTCSELEAIRANIPATMCMSLQQTALDPCGCDYNQLPLGADKTSFVCPVCGDGLVIANPSASVRIVDGQDEVQCGALEINSHKFSQDQCPDIQRIANGSCGCVRPEMIPDAVNPNGFEIEEVLSECSICGEREMTFPDGIVTSRQGISATCYDLERNPTEISQTACSSIQALARQPCGCIFSFQPVDTDILNEIVPFHCSICGRGEITNPDGIVTTPEGQAGRCNVLDLNAHTIPEDSCPEIQRLADGPCGCTVSDTGTVENEESLAVQDVDESLVCHVCGGPAQVISNPGQMVEAPTGLFTCFSIFNAGLSGRIPMEDCESLQTAVGEQCGCYVDGPTASPSEPLFTCSVCANGMYITNPDGIIDATNNISCAQYEQEAAKGRVSENQCTVLQQVSGNACGCESPPPIQTTPPATYQCEPCGKGRMIGQPTSEFMLPNFLTMSCGDLQKRADEDTINEFQCRQYQPFVQEHCGCVDKPYTEPSVASFECNICGRGLRVTKPEGVVTIPAQPDRTCTELMNAATLGDINTNQCYLLHPFVQGPCGCTAITQDSQTPAPSLSVMAPTYSPAPDDCFSDFRDIQASERGVRDTSIKRKYVICPGRIYEMGVWTEEGEIKDGQPFLALRPNVIYQCGEDGSRSNDCVLKGGDFGLASYYGVFEGIHETVPGVEVRGLTFQSQNMFSVLLKSAGDITFTGCAFKGNGKNTPVLLQWEEKGSASDNRLLQFDQLSETEEQKYLEQVVIFDDCVFRDNYVDDKSMSFPGIIENTFKSELVVRNCLFEGNVYGSTNNPASTGYAIRSFGPLTLESSCFIDNEFLNHGPVLVYGAQYSALNNYVQSSQTDLTCELGALFSSQEDMAETTPSCELSDATACPFTQIPTSSPSRSSVRAPVGTRSPVWDPVGTRPPVWALVGTGSSSTPQKDGASSSSSSSSSSASLGTMARIPTVVGATILSLLLVL
uniref:Right handed beta helix domain-containing protein n=2 Tax=Pseudo-nitzschia australis TaxID=44445 RepID=A0A7S4END4_9STRA